MNNFIEQVLVFIGSSLILVPIFRWLRFGSVLGYLMAGIIVGPHGFKLIHDSESVMHFAELGVILLLFLIGLEIQPRKLWSMRRHLVGLGGLQVLICSVVFAAVGLTLGLPALTAGLIGFALSLSSTAYAVQTLVERNQFNTEFGRSSFAILLMQDLLAIPALAIIPFFQDTNAEKSFSLQGSLIAIGVILLLILGSRLLIRPLIRIIAATRAREIFTAAALFIVLSVAAIMQNIGLSAALGTFIAGVVLADSEYRHELEANLEPFKNLLMGLFFIAVGMGVSLELILSRPVFVFGLAIAYLILKAALIYFSGRVFKLSHENSKRMAMTISQGGEFAFVIFGMAAQLNLGSSGIWALLTAVITLSMALNPVMGMISDWLTQKLKKTSEPSYDEIKDETPDVIIAGVGRFGQIIGRILRAQNIPFVAIDHDSEHIELLRKFGNKVYFGDASRKELLESAGARTAKYFILCIDDVDTSVLAAKMIREEFPHLKIFARARNRGHVFDLMDLKVPFIKREVIDSSVYFAGDLLVEMGMDKNKVDILIEKFKTHDQIMMEEQFKVRDDDKRLVSVSRQGVDQLSKVLSEDQTQSFISADSNQRIL